MTRYVGRENVRKRLAPLEGEQGRTSYANGVARIELPGETIVVRPPFGLPHEQEYDAVRLAPLLEALAEDRIVAALLVRLGGYAVGVFDGERLVASKVGSRFVKGRHKKGGSSANRFRRRREEQARALIEEAAEVAVRVLEPWRGRIEFVALGGDRAAIRDVLAASPQLDWLTECRLPRFFTVAEPRRRELDRLPYDLYSAELTTAIPTATRYARPVQETRAGTGTQTKFLLQESELPRRWYNIRSDMPTAPQPVLHPGTGQPVGPDDLSPLFPMELIGQEVSEEAEIAIPDEVLDIYRLWRPTPLYRAHRLEAAIGTRSRIFYKYEGVSPAGSHKPNTAVAQAFYNKQEGRTRLSTETGAGQWGSALSFACKLLGLECKVYMVRISYDQKPFRRSMIQAWGAEIVASPSQDTQSGRAVLEEHPDSPGSLGIAISEAVEDAAQRDDTAYSLGSVLNHVLLHQTVIGQEALAQMELADAFPDVVIGCVGGGSNFAGLAFPFLREKIAGRDIDVLACEPAACPTLTRGQFAYDFGDTAQLTPLVPMHTLGHDFIPAPIHAGGLRYHGVAPLISQLVLDGLIRAEAYLQNDVFASAVLFAGSEGILPAPEASHAIHGALQVAKAADEAGEERTILFNLSGHGHFDMAAYDNYFAGKLEDVALDEDEMQRALHALEGLPSPA